MSRLADQKLHRRLEQRQSCGSAGRRCCTWYENRFSTPHLTLISRFCEQMFLYVYIYSPLPSLPFAPQVCALIGPTGTPRTRCRTRPRPWDWPTTGSTSDRSVNQQYINKKRKIHWTHIMFLWSKMQTHAI
jgi:hypothetical protein